MIYQTFGNGFVRSQNLAIAVSMNRSIEGGSGFAESLLVGSCRDEGVGVTGFEGSGKPSFDVLMISFRFQQRERLPAA
jgi:hypothetical protein